MRLAISILGIASAGTLSAQQPIASPKSHPRSVSMRQDTSQAALRAQAKVREDSARAIALATVSHGAIQSSELEHEHGTLIYSFDIKVAGKTGIDEVNIDAVTGAVVAHVHETPAAERREARQDAANRRAKKHKTAPDTTKSP